MNGVENYVVEVNVPVDAPTGEYLFHLDMLGTEDPDETYTTGPAVKLLVGAPEKKEKRPFPWWIILVAVGVLAVIGAVIFWPRRIDNIAFISADRDGNYEIYVVKEGSSNPSRLTNNNATDFDPAWSPDGRRIAFHTNRDGSYEIYVMKEGSSNLIRITTNSANDINPAWSR